MRESSYTNICRHSAKRIKNLLDKSKNKLLSSSSPQKRDFPIHHKCNHIKISQILAYMDKVWQQEPDKLTCKEFQDKQRSIHVPNYAAVPTNVLDHGLISTQCCVNQKHVNHFFLLEGKNSQELLSRRHFQMRFREYILACRELKKMPTQDIPNARKYQIAILKDENLEENVPSRPTDWMPIKMEERHFLMGHTIKHP